MEQSISRTKQTHVRYGMLALVFVNVVINYLDRSNMAVAGAALSKDLGLSSVQLGLLFSAFGWTYAFLQIPGGLIADRFVPRILYAFCLIAWSIVTLCQGFVRGFSALFALRMATGAFEAPSYPINNRIVTSWFPDSERAFAIGIYVSGQFLGLAVLVPALKAILPYVGWQGLFITTGLIGVVWGLVWYVFYRDPLEHSRVNAAELNYIETGGGLLKGRKIDAGQPSVWHWNNLRQVLSSRTLWGVYIGQFAVNATLWFFLTWFPSYLSDYRKLTFIKSSLWAGAIPFLAAAAGVLLSGYFSDRLVKRGTSVSVARKTPIIAGLLLSVSIVGANYTNDPVIVIFFMSLAFFGAGMALISWVFVSILSPKHLIGLTGGVFNFMGNLASIVVPIVIGYLVQDGDFKPALLFIGAIALLGACSYIFLVGKIERVGVHTSGEKERLIPEQK